MTINVVVKCPDGIVMGTDSLLSIAKSDDTIGSIIPYFSKLYPMGQISTHDSISSDSRTSTVGSKYAAGAMINGAGFVAGRTIEDIIEEFGETYDKPAKDYDLRQLAEALADEIQKLIDSEGKGIALELIVSGYSRGDAIKGKRYGEIYSIFWEQEQGNFKPVRYHLEPLYNSDTQFGTYYGGQVTILDRVLFGIDEWILSDMDDRCQYLFDQARDYIISKLKEKNTGIPEDVIKEIHAPEYLDERLSNFNIYNLISKWDPGVDREEIIKKVKDGNFQMEVKKGATRRLKTTERFFSLQTAVNFCSFLMWCSYAESAFTNIIPKVGSEMRVATITRHEGFRFRKVWEIQSPGPPFR